MLKVPDHQVAGHKAEGGKLGPLIDDSGRFYKPLQGDERGANEVSFYTSFSSNTKIPDHITRFFPKFYGTQLVEASDGSGMQPHLVMQDFTFDRVNPSVMDIKIGSRTWPSEAPEEYVQKCLKKDRETSSLALGFRASGAQIFQSEKSGYWKPESRASIQAFTADEVRMLLKNFVSSNAPGVSDLKPDCAFASTVYGGSTGILSQLLELKAWFEDQTIYHFYSCSVLMMFEKELASSGKNPRAEIKLVDFAHVHEGKGVIDHNFLGGLCSFIKFISEILTTPEDAASSLEDAQRSHIYSDNASLMLASFWLPRAPFSSHGSCYPDQGTADGYEERLDHVNASPSSTARTVSLHSGSAAGTLFSGNGSCKLHSSTSLLEKWSGKLYIREYVDYGWEWAAKEHPVHRLEFC